MISNYARKQGYVYIAKRNWPITLLVLMAVSLGAFSLFALLTGFPSVAGIIVAFSVVIFLVTIVFAILPVYALDYLK